MCLELTKSKTNLTHLLQDGLETGFRTGLGWDLLDSLVVIERFDLVQFAQRDGILGREFMLEDGFDHLPVTGLQWRIPQIGNHGQLETDVSMDYKHSRGEGECTMPPFFFVRPKIREKIQQIQFKFG